MKFPRITWEQYKQQMNSGLSMKKMGEMMDKEMETMGYKLAYEIDDEKVYEKVDNPLDKPEPSA